MRTSPSSVPPPHDLALERAVLGVALYDAALATRVAALPASLFFLDRHQEILRALRTVVRDHPDTPAPLTLWRHRSGVSDLVCWGGIIEDGIPVLHLEPFIEALGRLADQRAVRGGR